MALDRLPLTKVIWIIAGMGLALTMFFAAKDVWRNLTIEREMEQSAQVVELSIALSAMVHEQQKERGATAVFLSSNGTKFKTELAEQRSVLDTRHQSALDQLAIVQDEVSDPTLLTQLNGLEQLIGQVPAIRGEIDTLRMSRADAVGFYTDFNRTAIGLVGLVAKNEKDPGIARSLLTYRALMLGKDYAGLDRAIGASGFAVGAFAAGPRRMLIELPARQASSFDYVLAYGSPTEQEQLSATLQSDRAAKLERMRAVALSGNADAIAAITPSTWFDIQTAQIGELKVLEDTMAQGISEGMAVRISAARTALMVAFGLLLAGMGVAGWMSLRFIRIIKRRIDGIVAPLDELARGQIDVTIPDLTGTEFAPVTRAMEVFRKNTIARQEDEVERKRVLSTLQSSLNNMAAGNLEMPIENHFAEEYKGIRMDFNEAQAALRDVIQQVVGSARQINLGAEEVNMAADDLSSRAARQAATLEQTTSALKKTNEEIQSSAALAQNTNVEVAKTRTNAMQNEQMVDSTIQAMEHIQSSFEEVEKITSVIQDIAFQTNILALNAGVEATRAGDAGKGFGVVATEVRALAQRSSEAVKSIQELMAKSSENISNGARQVSSSGSALREMIKMIDSVGVQVEELASASTQSAQGLNKIDTALATLDMDTQQNAAMAEQSSAASQLLNQEVHKLSERTAIFVQNGMDEGEGQDQRMVA